jgi:ferredoxin
MGFEEVIMTGIAIITEACIDVKDRACVDVCPVQCIYEYDPAKAALVAEDVAGSGVIENTHQPNPDAVAVFSEVSSTSTPRSARRAPRATSQTSAPSARSTPRNTYPMARQIRATTRRIPIVGTTTRSSSSSAGVSLPIE